MHLQVRLAFPSNTTVVPYLVFRHCLPPGYVLKKDRVKFEQQNKGDEITLEELVEKERAALGHDLPKITLESFLAWKQRKRKQQAEKRSQDERRKRAEYKQGKQTGLSGRELFTFNPDLIAQDDEEADDDRYSVHSSDDEEGSEEGGEKVSAEMVAFAVNGRGLYSLFYFHSVSYPRPC